MTEEEPEKNYPIKSLHEFLSELDREWSRFKTGALLSLFLVSALLVVPTLQLFFSVNGIGIWNLVVFPLGLALLLYVAWMMIHQYKFLRRWERRMRLLVHLEEELISGKLGEKLNNSAES